MATLGSGAWRWAALVSLLVLGAACSGPKSDSDGGFALAELDQSTAAAQIRQLGELESERGNDDQAELLSDGVVTEAEYRQATMRLVECMENRGLIVSDLERLEGIYTWSWDFIAMPPEGMHPTEVGDSVDECSIEHQLGVLQAWNLMSRWRYREEVRPMIGRCLVDAGVDVPLPRSQEQVLDEDPDALNVVIGCEHQAISVVMNEGLPTE